MFDNDLRFAVELGPIGEGDLIAAGWVARGTYDGKDAEFRVHDLPRRAGNRFSEYWVLSEDPTPQLTN